MRKIIAGLENWPKTKGNEPIFQCSEEANFYAQLIYNNEPQISIVRKARYQARQKLKAMREKPSKDFNTMMHLACKGQFYRECLEEIDRIYNNKFTP